MGTEYRFQPIQETPTCYACHKRKVRCDALNQGTSCTNCKLDMKEFPLRREKKAVALSPYVLGEARTAGTSLSPRVSQHSATLNPKRDDVQSNSAGVSSRKRKSPPRSLDSSHTCSQQRQRSGQGSSHNVDDEVGLWMDMLLPNVLEQLELRSTKGSSRPNRHNINELNAEQIHHKCSETLLHAVDILTEVIIMHNSLSVHSGHSVPVVHPSADIHCAPENQVDDDAKKEENMEYTSSIWHQVGESIWNIDNPLDQSSALTPESLEYVAGSNFNIWSELNNFDLGSPSLLVPYDIEEAVS
ncbi:unnamed protein product [Penicillium nalgiovense]|nr:unnamed protein product [Penicillium nalgiovense]